MGGRGEENDFLMMMVVGIVVVVVADFVVEFVVVAVAVGKFGSCNSERLRLGSW